MNNKKIKAAFLVFIIIAALFIFLKSEHERDSRIVIGETDHIDSSTSEAITESVEIIIDVSGAVKSPSVVKLPEGSRVYEAIDAAGGLCEDASLNSLNRAAVLNDGDKIYIPTEDDQTINSTNIKMSSEKSDIININTATLENLQTLSGIGPATAEKIVDFRSTNGPFRSIEELMDVSGIGEKTFEKIKEKLCI